MSNALVISNLAKTFDGTRVLDDINLEVRAGEVHGVVGENLVQRRVASRQSESLSRCA